MPVAEVKAIDYKRDSLRSATVADAPADISQDVPTTLVLVTQLAD